MGFKTFKGIVETFTLWKLIIVLSACAFQCRGSAQRICRDFKNDFIADGLVENVQETYSDGCPLSSSKFSVYNVDILGNITEDRMSSLLLICWSTDVKSFALKFENKVVYVQTENIEGDIVYSCATENDTVLVHHKDIRSLRPLKLLLKPLVDFRTAYTFRALVNIKRQHKHKRKLLHYMYSPKISKINKRSVITDDTVTQPSECGQMKSCFRYGVEGCGHLSCDYFLSYGKKGSDLVIELSGNTSGWLAVGFSSDANMGGDEVIACSKKDLLSNDLQAGTFKNPIGYQRPQRNDGEEIVSLVKSEARNGYIYCHMTRPLSSSGHQDLTNDWYQFYAVGMISQGGQLEKHLTTPMISTSKVTVIRTRNVMINIYRYRNDATIVTSAMTSLQIVTLLILFIT